MIIDLKRSIDPRWLLKSGAIFISVDLVICGARINEGWIKGGSQILPANITGLRLQTCWNKSNSKSLGVSATWQLRWLSRSGGAAGTWGTVPCPGLLVPCHSAVQRPGAVVPWCAARNGSMVSPLHFSCCRFYLRSDFHIPLILDLGSAGWLASYLDEKKCILMQNACYPFH